jgi:hypothetical protein
MKDLASIFEPKLRVYRVLRDENAFLKVLHPDEHDNKICPTAKAAK